MTTLNESLLIQVATLKASDARQLDRVREAEAHQLIRHGQAHGIGWFKHPDLQTDEILLKRAEEPNQLLVVEMAAYCWLLADKSIDHSAEPAERMRQRDKAIPGITYDHKAILPQLFIR